MAPVPQEQRQQALRYLLAVAVTGVAVILTRAIQPFVAPSVTPPFILAVIIASLYGGKGPGALASILGVGAMSYWFFPPFSVDTPADLARQLMFLVVAGVTTWVAGSVHRQRWLAIRQAEENERLRQVAENAAQGLRESETELTDFFEAAAVGLHWVGEDGTILRANQAELDLLGYERDEYVGHHISEFHVDRPVIDDVLRRLAAGEVLRQYPARLRCKDGRVKDVLIDSSVYRHHGRFVHSRCVTRDVTLEKQAHEATARLAAIVSSSSDAIVGKTLDGIVTSWNAAAERSFGYGASEMIGQSMYKLIPEELHEAERAVLDRLRRGETVELTESERIRKDGARLWISLSVSPIRNSSGVIIGAASVKRDITERKRAEAELRQNQEQLWLAHQAARLGTWRWDVGTNVLRWDDGLRELYGLGPDDSVSGYDDFMGRVHPDDRERVGRSVQQALTGSGTLDYEFRVLLPDGRVRWLADLGRVTTDPAGKPLYMAGVCLDVTERKTVEEHLRDTQRLQSVGQLAGGIAHEANNQMSVVLGAAQFLLRRPDLAPQAREDVEYIRQAAERTASITQQLLAFSRRQILQLQDVDLNRLVRSIEPVLRRSLAENHELSVRLGLRDGLVRADPRQLEQVLLNLTLNARDAMPGGGRLSIETSDTTLSAEDTGGDRNAPQPGDYALVVVKDAGSGMDQATLKRAFEPFFTTKAVGEGSGLGLSVVHGIVNQTGGYIRVDSEPGKGATFELYFPLASTGRTAEVATASDPVPASPGRVALVVEDDALVRSMAVRGLLEAGYTALEAADGRAALEMVRSHNGRLDVVITDIGMPEFDGYELANRLRAERPDLPVLFMSGYGDTDPVGPFLQKPFGPDALVRMVAEVLASSPR
jgi:PAS domain S-box-containing protein